MNIPFTKLHPDAKTPTRSYRWDGGYNLYVHDREYEGDNIIYKTGIAVSIPPGYIGFLFMRSSVRDTQLILANAVGVIDPFYHGDLTFTYRKLSTLGHTYAIKEKCGQLIVLERPAFDLVEVDELPQMRGGHGSTGH